ncbi:MAG: GC-type dockerin domain-anchored protein [Planctomycetota bacterium]
MSKLWIGFSFLVSLNAVTTAQDISDVRVGIIDVAQNDAENEFESVTTTLLGGSTRFSVTSQNRADISVGFGTGDDLRSAVMIPAIRNLDRTNAETGGNGGGDLIATAAAARPDSNTSYFVATHGAPSGTEMNVDIAAALFPFNAGFFGGHAWNDTNNGPLVNFVGSPGLELGDEFVDPSTNAGRYELDLRGFGASGQNGVVIAAGGKNEGNYAQVQNNGDGTYVIACQDNGIHGTSGENDPVAFVYLPYQTQGLVAGRIAENNGAAPAVLSGTQGFTLQSAGVGRVLVRIDGVTGDDQGVLLLTPERGNTRNQNNLVVSAWDDALGGYIVETRDVPSMAIEGMAGEPAFSFAYIPVTAGPGFETRPATSTLVALPDTQNYAQRFPDVFIDQADWIAQAAIERQIDMVMHLGDITNRNNTTQWRVARDAYNIIRLHAPYILAQGNHDVGPNGNATDRTTLMNTFFSVSSVSLQPTFGATMEPDKIENSYSLFESAGRKWIVVALEWGPRDQAVTWANDILSQYPDRLAIVITHTYTYNDDTLLDNTVRNYGGSPYNYGTADLPGGTNDGGDLWRKLVSQHANVVMTLSGHIRGEGLVTDVTPFGNVVHQMLADYQFRPEGGQGFLRLYELTPDSDIIRVRTYSPWQDRYLTGPGSMFELPIITGVPNGGRVCLPDYALPLGQLDAYDLFAYLDAIEANDPAAELAGSGIQVNNDDVNAFVNALAEGCSE